MWKKVVIDILCCKNFVFHCLCRVKKGAALLFHLHHLHQGALGGRDHPGGLHQGIQGPAQGGICKYSKIQCKHKVSSKKYHTNQLLSWWRVHPSQYKLFALGTMSQKQFRKYFSKELFPAMHRIYACTLLGNCYSARCKELFPSSFGNIFPSSNYPYNLREF